MTLFLSLIGFFLAAICGTILLLGIPYYMSKCVDRAGSRWSHRLAQKVYHRHHKH